MSFPQDWHRKNVKHWYKQTRHTKEQLDTALIKAREDGVHFTTLANWMGLSEAAVRMKFKRKGWE